MEKKKFFLFIYLLFSNVCMGSSQETHGMQGPTEILQYGDALYTEVYKIPPGITAIIADRWGGVPIAYVDSYNYEEKGYRYFGQTIIPLEPGDLLRGNDLTGFYKMVNVKPNPLNLMIPTHICPFGTQIACTTIVSNKWEKVFSVSGNPSAAITNSGMLTYTPGQSGVVLIKYSLVFEGKEYASIEKTVSLNPHMFYATYYRNNNGRIEMNDVTNYNYITNKEEVDIRMATDYDDFTWEVPYGGAKNIQYNKALRSFKFTPTYTYGDAIKFRFKFKCQGCPQYTTFDCYFEIDVPYNVSYLASSNVIKISKDFDSANSSRMANTPETYKLVNSATGVVKKQGQLAHEVNEIDASDISKGIYIVQITSGSKVKSYKISINR